MSKKKQTGKTGQHEKFKEAAQEAECDPSEEAFEERLRRIASSSPSKKDALDRDKPERKKKG